MFVSGVCFDVGTALFEMEICLNEKQASENDRQASSGTNAAGDTCLLGNPNLITAHMYSIPLSISIIIRMCHVTSPLCTADSARQEGDVITWENIAADSCGSKLFFCKLISDCNAPYK